MSYPITFSTSWYRVGSKFPKETYFEWIHNFLSGVRQFYLVIYCDETSVHDVQHYADANPARIKTRIVPFADFENAKYDWAANHAKNWRLNQKTEWQLNMLWAEKTAFVKKTMMETVFPLTEYYGWCDIGYWRGRPGADSPITDLFNWPSPSKIYELNPQKIHYARVVDTHELSDVMRQINRVNLDTGLPTTPIPDHICSIAGGFFIAHRTRVEWWRATFDEMVARYFKHGYLIKDDQIIVANCVFTNLSAFKLYYEPTEHLDHWFAFQRILYTV